MDLSLSQDQRIIMDALDGLARPFESVSLHNSGFALTDPALDDALAQGGFLDVGFDPSLGVNTAALVAQRLARLPQAIEAAMSLLVRPLLGDGVTGPICMMREGRKQPLLRYLRDGASLVIVGAQQVRSLRVAAAAFRPEPAALYGYPVATLLMDPAAESLTRHDIDPQQVMIRWRIALAAEAAGLLAAALASVCDHTSQRQQFGRPLASFQGMRHRLAEAQVRANGVYWLAMKAAATLDPADAALAALHAQESARAVVYDFHQFMGAMGMTLEHPLHLWTYRLKWLISETGGRADNALAAADALWR
jgi:Acyl-CoA dehydrogenase, C-terminal domain